MTPVYLLAGFVAVLLPLIYDIVIRASVPDDDYALKHQIHITLNMLATLFSLGVVLKAKGDFEYRLKIGLISVLINFSVLLLLIMSLRLYYSRPTMIASFFASIAIVSTFNMLIERYRRRRIGIVPGSLDAVLPHQIDPNAVMVASPDEPSWAYDTLLIDWAKVRDPRWLQFATRAILTGCDVHHVAAYIESYQGRVVPEHFEIDHAASPCNSLYVLCYKRVIDIAVILILAPVAIVVVSIAGMLVAVTMGRPIFFTQKRVGIDGRPFTMYKLRTMVQAKPGVAVSATKVGDARITPLGKFMRRVRIDELPQFYNIIKGDMSLIGPRPEQPELARQYAQGLPQFFSRTVLRPGITGWAQVRGSYAADAAETRHKLAYDLYYLKHASLMMDLAIVAQTFRTLLTGNSAR